MIYNIEI